MRLYLSGPHILGGLVRPGISFGPEDWRQARDWHRRLGGGSEPLGRAATVAVASFERRSPPHRQQ
jgi:hypothetical protein